MKLLYRMMIDLTNILTISKLIQKFTTSKQSKKVISSFAKTFKINLEEAEKEIDNYHSMHDFFTRKLKPGSRYINSETNSVISPVDGFISDVGVISSEKIITVKGKKYSIAQMLDNSRLLTKYIGGSFLIIYLSPSDYHRIHSPISGLITYQNKAGKHSYPVNTYGLKYGKDTLASNYRVISEIKHEGKQHMALVKVGALFINSVELTHTSNAVEKGEEVAYFSFGSTVVMLFEKDSFEVKEDINDSKVLLGETLGYLK